FVGVVVVVVGWVVVVVGWVVVVVVVVDGRDVVVGELGCCVVLVVVETDSVASLSSASSRTSSC
ncbi:MAG: hypothetical protein F4085_04105, partial [Acidimicrobiia bacterium]|nr:hypothetical protein [Acidimicrobiia bacterium]